MKKLLAIVLGGAMTLSLAACGGQARTGAGRGDDEPANTPEITAEVPEETAAPEATAVPEATAAPEETAAPDPTAAPEETAEPEQTETPEQTAAPDAEATTGEDTAANAAVPGVSPEFKEVMDSYEAFFDEYAAFMEKYQNSDNSTSMLMDYLSFLSRYAEAMQKLDEIDTDSLSAADQAYYTQVMLRISGKLMGAAG